MLKTFTDAITPRTIKSNEKTSVANQPLLQIGNTPVFALIVAYFGVIIIFKIVLQRARNVTVADLWAILPEKVAIPQPQSLQPQQKNVNQIDTTTGKSDGEDLFTT